jgi:hypothetical protein
MVQGHMSVGVHSLVCRNPCDMVGADSVVRTVCVLALCTVIAFHGHWERTVFDVGTVFDADNSH